MERHDVALPAGRFSYLEAGTGDPVVLLHALGRDAEDWETVIDSLADRHRCLALDQRGHGQSVRTDHYGFSAMAGDLAEFADALRLGTFSLIGHSMGGTVAWLHAETHPARLRRLVLEDTAPPRPGEDWPEVPPEPPGDVSFDWEARRQIFRELADPDPAWWGRIPDVTVPTMIIAGDSPSPVLEAATALLPHGELVTIPAGHWIHESEPVSFLLRVEPFLSD